jgi:E3 ubiquitin-protein ligase SHPRH
VSRVIGALKLRLREVMYVMHEAVFFIGNGYFGMGDKPTEEDAAYAEAEAIRKRVCACLHNSLESANILFQLLHSDEMEAQKEIIKMDHRLHEKRIKARDVMFSLPETDGGLQSSRIFEDIEKTSEKANEVAELMLKWRKGELFTTVVLLVMHANCLSSCYRNAAVVTNR